MKPPKNTKHLLFGGTFVLANKLQFIADKMVEGLPLKQWFLLRNMMDLPVDPPPSITQIANAMDSTRQNIAKMLEVMAREGYITLEKNQTDLRSRNVHITETGLKAAEETAENAQNFLDELFENISEDERSSAGKVFMKMMENLQKMQESLSE